MTKQSDRAFQLSRRSLITAATALAGAALLADGGSAAAEEPAAGGLPGPNRALVDAAVDCVRHASICEAHCIAMLSAGNTSMKDCIKTVTATIPLCNALVSFAATNSPRLKELAKLCIDVCDDCAKECKKHADKHAVCKRCLDACEECIKECKKVI